MTHDQLGTTAFLALAFGAMLLISVEILRLGRAPVRMITHVSPPPWSAPIAPTLPGPR